MNKLTDVSQGLSFWQLVFLQSKVNEAPYHGEELPRHYWEWPKNTYFQHRFRQLKRSQITDLSNIKLSAEDRFELLYKDLLEEYQRP